MIVHVHVLLWINPNDFTSLTESPDVQGLGKNTIKKWSKSGFSLTVALASQQHHWRACFKGSDMLGPQERSQQRQYFEDHSWVITYSQSTSHLFTKYTAFVQYEIGYWEMEFRGVQRTEKKKSVKVIYVEGCALCHHERYCKSSQKEKRWERKTIECRDKHLTLLQRTFCSMIVLPI